MKTELAFIVMAAGLPVPMPVIIVAGLILAIVVLVAALLLFRNSGKKKKGGMATPGGAADWQRQSQMAAPGGWNQPGMGGPTDNPWAQQQQAAQGWGAQNPGQQANPWAQQQQQPAANSWGAQNPAAQQAANPWGGSAVGPNAGNQWDNNAFAAQQQQQPDNPWAQQQQAPTQQGTPAWGMSGSSPNQPAATGGFNSSNASGPAWGQPAQAAQADPWAQQQQQQQQPAAQGWGAPAQPQAAPFGGSGSGPAWGQPAQPAQADPWATPGQGAPQQGGWGQPAAGNSGPAWQQQGSPFGNQAGFGGNVDGDKTMLRSNTPGTIGIVRVEEGKEPGRVYEVRKDSLSIGRSRESDIFLEDLAVSRLHASIVNTGNGNYALKDEGSANGTKVNGQLVNKYQQYPLQEGDRIQLGQTVLVFAKR